MQNYIPDISFKEHKRRYILYISKALDKYDSDLEKNMQIDKLPYFYWSEDGLDNNGPELSLYYDWYTPFGIVPKYHIKIPQEEKKRHFRIIVSFYSLNKQGDISPPKTIKSVVLKNHPNLLYIKNIPNSINEIYYYVTLIHNRTKRTFKFLKPLGGIIEKLEPCRGNNDGFNMTVKVSDKKRNWDIFPEMISEWDFIEDLKNNLEKFM